MRVGVVANIEDPEAGFVEERLDQLGASFFRRWRTAPETFDRFEHEVDLLVLLGSDWSVYDASYAHPIGAERDLIQRAGAAGCPTLGICFGGQMIASALDLAVARAPRPEVGWSTISSDRPDLTGDGPWFQFHADRWAESGDDRTVARNGVGPQAVIVGRTLGLQFHPEVTEEVAARWIREAPEAVVDAGGDPDALIAENVRMIPDARARCFGLVDAFLATVAQATQ